MSLSSLVLGLKNEIPVGIGLVPEEMAPEKRPEVAYEKGIAKTLTTPIITYDANKNAPHGASWERGSAGNGGLLTQLGKPNYEQQYFLSEVLDTHDPDKFLVDRIWVDAKDGNFGRGISFTGPQNKYMELWISSPDASGPGYSLAYKSPAVLDTSRVRRHIGESQGQVHNAGNSTFVVVYIHARDPASLDLKVANAEDKLVAIEEALQ